MYTKNLNKKGEWMNKRRGKTKRGTEGRRRRRRVRNTMSTKLGNYGIGILSSYSHKQQYVGMRTKRPNIGIYNNNIRLIIR